MPSACADIESKRCLQASEVFLRGLLSFLFVASLVGVTGCKRDSGNASKRPPSADAGQARKTLSPPPVPPPGPNPIDAGTPLTAEERAAIPGLIAFIDERGEKPQTYLVKPDGTGERRLGPEDGQARYPASPSADGKSLLVIAVREEGPAHFEQVELHSLTRKAAPVKLGPASQRSRSPWFTKDGRSVVFESGANSFSDIYRVGRDGKGLKRLTEHEHGNFEPHPSPDGKTVAFVSSRDGDSEIYRMKMDGSEQQRLTAMHREDMSPEWSPDGERLAFISSREGTDRIFLMRPDGTQLERVHPEPAVVKMEGTIEEPWEADISWSPDGKRLAYTVRVAGERPRVWMKDVASGVTRPLTDGKETAEGAVFSPDGKYLAFTWSHGGRPALWLMRADGTGAVKLTDSPKESWRPVWIPTASR